MTPVDIPETVEAPQTPQTPGTRARPSPNIWEHPDVYEVENRGVDPDGLLEAAMQAHRPWAGAHVLDLGCGAGFHLPRFAAHAARVSGVEPHLPLVARARARALEIEESSANSSSDSSSSQVQSERRSAPASVQIVAGTARAIPLADACVDIVHARWAYFFGPGCEPGLAELARVVRPGGTAFVIDNDASHSTFGGWFRRQWPALDPAAIERFWRRHGWERDALTIRWEHATRADLEAVVGIEFAPELARAILSEHPGRSVDYAVNLWRREF